MSKLCVPGAKIVEVCQKGDQLMEEEVAKVYRGKKVTKGTTQSFFLCLGAEALESQLTLGSRLLAPHDGFALVLRHPVHSPHL